MVRLPSQFALLLAVLLTSSAAAHPGSGIFVDDQGTVYFADTGRGVWQIGPGSGANVGKLTLLSDVAMHWMAFDAGGAFAEAPDEFGEWFGRLTPRDERPTLLWCSDFPCAMGPDGNLYFAFMHGLTIKRRTPAGVESAVTNPGDFGYDDEHAVGVNGMACGRDGTIYIVMLDDLHQSEASADHWLYAVDPGKSGAEAVRLVAKNFIPADEIIPPDERRHEVIPEYCRALAVDEAGNVFVAGTGNRCVLRVTPEGESTVVLRCEKPWSPTAVAVRDGAVYVLEYDDETPTEGREWPPRVRRLSADGTVATLVTVER